MAVTHSFFGSEYEFPDGTSREAAAALVAAGGQTPTTSPAQQESTTQEIAEGIASGLIAIPQGVGELGASLVDLAFDTDYTQDVTDFANTVREMGGIDPEGAAGEIAEVVTQFVVPGLFAAGIVGRLGRVQAMSRVAQKASQIGAAGVTDAVVATDGVTTIGDFFGGGITQTTETVGLEGREAAAAKIGNKLKVGLEAVGATAAVDPVLRTLGFAGKGVAKGLAPVASPVAKGALKAGTAISSGVVKLADKHPMVEGFLSAFRSRGYLSQEAFEKQTAIRGEVDAEIGQVARTIIQVEEGIDASLKNSENVMADGSPLAKEEALNRFYSYLTKEDAFMEEAKNLGIPPLKMLPDEMQSAARKARVQVDRLSKQILSSDYLTREGLVGQEAEAAEIIQRQIGSYLRRRYKIFEDKNYIGSEQFKQNRLDTIDYFQSAPGAARNISEEIDVVLDEGVDIITEGGKEVLTRDAAERLTDAFVSQYSGRFLKSAGNQAAQTVAKNRLRTGLFKSRQANNEMLRRLLGEVKDPIEALTTTVADMAEFVATDRFYKYIGSDLLDDSSGMFVSQEAAKRLPRSIRDADYTELGEGFGSLQGSFARNDVYKNISMQTKAHTNDMAQVMRASYSAFLKGKGITQYAATVLSPVTQIRNVTSSSLFALAQGNVGSGANLFDSVGVVWDGIRKRPDKERYFSNLQRVGVVGNQAQLKEIDRLIGEGFGGTKGATEDAAGIPTSGSFKQTFQRGKPGAFLGSINRRMRDLYQGGDDIWKVYNFEFEKNKLLSGFGGNANLAARAVLGNEAFVELARRAAQDAPDSASAIRRATNQAIDEYAANIVKNTVPNYERVPEVIKEIRKLPVGNFIAFPAEIIRTSANTLKMSLDELASEHKAIREIGMRRLLGFTSTTVIAPTAIQKMAMDLAGVSQEQMDAIRENGMPWEKTSILLPTSIRERENAENVVTGYVNYSYTNPYAYLNQPARAILNAVSKGEEMGKSSAAIATDAALNVISEIFSPFAGEAILSEKLLDVTIRNGRTATGAKVYRPEADTPGDIALKSMAHISSAFVPGAVKLFADVKGQKKETQTPGIELGRLARAFAEDTTDPAGNERRIAQEIFRSLSGITETEVKPDNMLLFRGYEYGRDRQTAAQIFNTAVSTKGTLDPENAIQTYRDANEARYRIANNMYRFVQNMKRMGMSDRDIRRALQKNGVANARELMRGEFVPFVPSRDIEKRVRENGNRLPRFELRQIAREFKNRRLGEPVNQPEEEDPRTLDVSEVAPITSNTGAPSPSSVAPPATTAAPVPTTTSPQTRQALAGLNPGTQLIATRTGP